MVLSIFVVLLAWAWFSWPLPRYFHEGIPSSSQNVERGGVRTMMMGDHLQLLYHFQLVQDFISGRTPWFYNLYEFNTGDDDERYMPGSYYAPFSLPYVLFATLMSDAAAWNLVGLLTIWVTFIATLAYVRRFTPDLPEAAFLGALVSILLPYRWVSLLGGSPTGFAMMLPPLAALGLDGIVRTGRLRDGALAAVALFLSCWGDLHTFFFTTLSIPLWMGLAALDTNLLGRLRWRVIRTRVPAMVAAASGLLAAAVYRMVQDDQLAESEMGAGRTLREVLAFSPSIRGFWSWAASGLHSHIYLGLTAALILVGAAAVVVMRQGADRSRYTQRMITAFALVVTLAVLILALGMRGPFQGLAPRILRVMIPPYTMVRQTAKIFVVLPTLLALLSVLTIDHFKHRFRLRRWPGVAVMVGLLAVLALAEYKAQVRTTVCLLDPEQEAYAAVARDAKQRAETPRALVLPIWPGEAAQASVYQFHALQYGIRLVNGYSPRVSRDYLETVFEPLQVVNQGMLTDSEIDRLASMGVRYLILHEDMFPEQVSPFPVTLTRDRLMGHARLTRLARDGPVWSFRIKDTPREPPSLMRRPSVRFPTRQIRFEHLGAPEDRESDITCAGHGYLALREGGQAAVAGRPWGIAPKDDLAWYVRVRGQGTLKARTVWNGKPLDASLGEVSSDDWTWIALPLATLPGYGAVQGVFRATDGTLDADVGLLIAGDWSSELAREEVRTFEAADFFHAGYSEWETQEVVFRPEREPDGAIFYGPRLPLEPGRYRLAWEIHSDAPAGTELGRVNVRQDDVDEGGWVFVRAGEPFEIRWEQPHSLPVNWVFVYHRTGAMRIGRLTLERE